MDFAQILTHIRIELVRAKQLHPQFPTDPIHQTSIMVEEAGEALRAALNFYYHNEDIAKLKTELIQTGAMVFRVLENLP